MKIGKLHIILTCTIATLSANSYAWHNELPKGGFNICNKTGKEVKVELDHFHNVKWQVPDGSGWNTKTNYTIKNNECGLLQLTTDWGGTNEYTKLYVGIKPADGSNSEHVGFDIRSYTQDQHERRGADSNQLNSWNVMSYQSSGNWNAEALVEHSVYYSKETVCTRYSIDGFCMRREDKFYRNQNGSGLLDLSVYGTGSGNSLFKAPGDIQEIDIISKNVPTGLAEQKLANALYSLFNNKLAPANKASVLENLRGRSVNWSNYPNAKLCRVYGVAIDSAHTKIINEKTSNVTSSLKSKLPAVHSEFENPGKEAITRTTASYSQTKTEARAATLTTGWKWGIGAKLAAKFNAVVKEGSYEISSNYEYNQGTSDTYTISETNTYNLPPQNIVIPPGKKVTVNGWLEIIQINSKFSFDYVMPNPTVRADVGLDGNCGGKVETATINSYNLLKNINLADQIDGISANPRQTNSILLNGQGTLSGDTGLRFVLKDEVSDIPNSQTKSRVGSSSSAVPQILTKYIPLDAAKSSARGLDMKGTNVNPFGN